MTIAATEAVCNLFIFETLQCNLFISETLSDHDVSCSCSSAGIPDADGEGKGVSEGVCPNRGVL